MPRLAALALLFAFASVGCAMSRESLDRLEADVSERNAARRQTAGAELAAEGYVEAEALRRHAVLDEADRERCLSREPGEAPMHIELRGEPPLALTAPPEATCDFFRRRTRELATLSEPSNDQTVLHAVPDVGVMRAPDGEVVLVRFALRTVATHEVLVDMECDHMPRVEPDPLTLGGGQVPVVVAPERPRELTREVDHELVRVECTRNTY